MRHAARASDTCLLYTSPLGHPLAIPWPSLGLPLASPCLPLGLPLPSQRTPKATYLRLLSVEEWKQRAAHKHLSQFCRDWLLYPPFLSCTFRSVSSTTTTKLAKESS